MHDDGDGLFDGSFFDGFFFDDVGSSREDAIASLAFFDAADAADMRATR